MSNAEAHGPSGGPGVQINLACFQVCGSVYAFDVTHVREIVRSQPIAPLPKAPALIDGVIDLRDSMIPVVDLGRALGGDRGDAGPRARIAILDIDGLVIGVAVEAATDVLTLAASELRGPPELALQAGYDAVRAVVRRPGEAPVMVLSAEHILECVYRSALPARGDA